MALVLFSMGGLFAIYEGIDKLIHPHETEALGVAVAILIISIVLESFSLRTAVRESRPYKGALSWWQFIRSSRNPELPVVLLEDTGALCGLVFALVGVVLARCHRRPPLGRRRQPRHRRPARDASPSCSPCEMKGAADRRVGHARDAAGASRRR